MAEDFAQDTSVLREAISREFPELAIESIQVNHEGWDNVVAIVNNAIVFRFPRNLDDEVKLDREIRLLSIIREFPVKIPEYIYRSTGKTTLAGYPYIPGSRLDSAGTLSHGLLAGMVSIIMRLMEIRPASLDVPGIPVYRPDTWVEKQNKVVKDFEAMFHDYTDPRFFPEIWGLFEKYVNGLPENSINLVHADMYRGNVIISPEKDRIVGVIDWEDSIFSDIALDIAALSMDFGNIGTAKLLASLNLNKHDPGIGGRVKFYQKIEFLYLAQHMFKTGKAKGAIDMLSSASRA